MTLSMMRFFIILKFYPCHQRFQAASWKCQLTRVSRWYSILICKVTHSISYSVCQSFCNNKLSIYTNKSSCCYLDKDVFLTKTLVAVTFLD